MKHKCDSICYQYGCDGGHIVDRIDQGEPDPIDLPANWTELPASYVDYICENLPIRHAKPGGWEAEAEEAGIDQSELFDILNTKF